MTATPRYRVTDLVAFTEALFVHHGLEADKAAVVAPMLVEADMMGHDTHGLQLAANYLKALSSGDMRGDGAPDVIHDHGAALAWDGGRRSGVWLTAHAVDTAVDRAGAHGTATVVIRNSHHIACLAAFLPRATAAGCMIILSSSDPSTASVAPYGGTAAVFTPNPIAIGIPTEGDPILIDISASITTNGMTGRLHGEGKPLPHAWVQDAAGAASTDPGVLFTDPPGTILPIGGQDHGHKGYGLALMIEAMTQALSGFGRADTPTAWGASVFVQVIDPAAFAGREAFTRQTAWLAAACRENPPAHGDAPVRLPGERALARRRAALSDGLALYPGIMEGLAPLAATAGLSPPAPLT